MHSHTDASTARSHGSLKYARQYAEYAARAIAIVALGAAWWLTGRPAVQDPDTLADALAANDAAVLAQVASDPMRSKLVARLQSLPDASARAVLHAAGLAGLEVSWQHADSAGSLPAIAASASPLADPGGGTLISVAAPESSTIALSDSLGWIDSVVVREGGVRWLLRGASRDFIITHANGSAGVGAAPVIKLGRIRLFASAGWEARFAMRALEEAGWNVDASFQISPLASVSAGTPVALDTAVYAAVVALDSAAWPHASAIARFVRSGGGLVLFPQAAVGASVSAIRVGSVGEPVAGIPGALRLDRPREGLAMHPIIRLSDNSVVLERSGRSGSPIAMAARRVAAGRVLQVGYLNTWEWRMLGDDDAVTAHRDWWRVLLQRVANVRPSEPVPWAPLPGNAAPLADLVARIGPASINPDELDHRNARPAPPPAWLFALSALALLAEWWSRRLRGAR